MIMACLFRILDFLAASLVDALGSHRSAVSLQSKVADEVRVTIDQLKYCVRYIKLQDSKTVLRR